MNIVVTGAAGRLGRVTMRALRAAGHDVRGIDKAAGQVPAEHVVSLDLLEAPAVAAALAGAEVVVHLANHPTGYGREPTLVYNENVAMNFNVAEAARRAGATRLVFASSIQAFRSERRLRDGLPSALPWLPLDGAIPAAPTNPYGLSKAHGEQLLEYVSRVHGMTTVALRFPWLLNEPPPAEGWPVQPDTFLDECFTWLTYTDAAACIAAAVTADLPGAHCCFPAAARPWAAGAPERLRQLHFAGVAVASPGPLTSFVDLAPLTRDLRWSPADA